IQPTSTHSTLSFCLPTSLSFVKRLTWEQTPWIPHTLDDVPINPIPSSAAHTIAAHLSRTSHIPISAEAVENALFFGSGESANMKMKMGIAPHLFVIFPHAPTAPFQRLSTNPEFLRIWHDNIMKPAFDTAWHDSGLAPAYGAAVNGASRILPATGVRTLFAAHPWTGFAFKLQNFQNTGAGGVVHTNWPPSSPQVLEDAWMSIRGMLKDYPGLETYQDPILLAVSRAAVHFPMDMSVREIFSHVEKEWEEYVDMQCVVEDSFGVVLETVVGKDRDVGSVEEEKK
ncbi:hypothetical protein EK21DRAFT_43244, partial [Setomelanomma holmii]